MRKSFLLEIIVACSLFLFILLSVLHLVSFDRSFYQEGFENYEVYDAFEKDLVDEEFEKVLVYLEGSETFESEFFSERDKLHLYDVRILFERARALIFLSSLVFLFGIAFFLYRRNYHSALRSILYASSAVLVLFILLSLFTFVDFQATFTLFHKLLFSNDLWLLDPALDNLVNILPLEIFMDITERFVLYSVGVAGVLGLGSLLLLRKHA